MSNSHQCKSFETGRIHNHPCSCCSMSRRSFLGAAAACTAALTTGCANLESLHTTPKAHEEIDLASFRPRPKVRVMTAIAREKPPYWLGWPGTAYDVEGERARYSRAIADAGGRVGIEISKRDSHWRTVQRLRRCQEGAGRETRRRPRHAPAFYRLGHGG